MKVVPKEKRGAPTANKASVGHNRPSALLCVAPDPRSLLDFLLLLQQHN